MPVLEFILLFLWVQLFEPRVEIPDNIFRINLRGSLQLSVHAMLIYFFHWVNSVRLQNMQPHNFDGVLFLIDMVRRPKDFAEASLSDQGDVLKFLVEPPGVKNVVQG